MDQFERVKYFCSVTVQSTIWKKKWVTVSSLTTCSGEIILNENVNTGKVELIDYSAQSTKTQ